jgi:hypothetical protein
MVSKAVNHVFIIIIIHGNTARADKGVSHGVNISKYLKLIVPHSE